MNDKKSEKFYPTEKAKKLIELYSPETDPQGWYTGNPENRSERPVQDADDL